MSSSEKIDVDMLKAKVKEILKANSEFPEIVDQIDVDSELMREGINSITFIKTAVMLEAELGIEFDDSSLDIGRFMTLGSLVSYIERKLAQVL